MSAEYGLNRKFYFFANSVANFREKTKKRLFLIFFRSFTCVNLMAITTHFCALMAQFSINNTSFVIGGTMWTAPLRQISMLWTNLSIKTKKVVKNANPFSVSMTKKNSGKNSRHPKISLPALLPIILPTISCNKQS